MLLVLLIVAGGGLAVLWSEFDRLRRRVGQLESRLFDFERLLNSTQAAAPARPKVVKASASPRAPLTEPLKPADAMAEKVAVAQIKGPAAKADLPTPPRRESKPRQTEPAEPQLNFAERFERLIGGSLPIWIGGVALVLGGFFLVRYSIEAGLLGPPVRTVLAALLGFALLVASEAARRIPRFAEDPRVAQSLAGAGIASLYGTLYMASQLFGLIGPMQAFIAMALVTAAALFLSLRHGAPTAIMGLIGGFAAPFMAAPGTSLIPLLVYLGLLIAGLFAVAIQRGWMWLALAATGGGMAWSVGILAADLAGIGPSLGVFIVAAAIGATLFLPRTGASTARVRILPLVAGFVQLALFAPAIEFGAIGWIFYAMLSGASLWLGKRDAGLMPGAVAALGLVLILIFAAFVKGAASAPLAAVGATLLFAVPGHALARTPKTNPWWTILALAGGCGPLIAAWMSGGDLTMTENRWGLLFAAVAVPPATLSWRAEQEGRLTGWPDWALFGGGIVAPLMAMLAVLHLAATEWMSACVLGIAVALSVWARRVQDRALFVGSLVVAGFAALVWLAGLVQQSWLAEAVLFDGEFESFQDLGALLLAPAILLAGMAWSHRGRLADQPLRWASLLLVLATLLALVPSSWHPAILALAAIGLLAGSHRLPLPRFGVEAGFVILGLSMLPMVFRFGPPLVHSLGGGHLPYPLLPIVTPVLRQLALPALLVSAALIWQRRNIAMPVWLGIWSGVALAAVLVFYLLVKQIYGIASEEEFVKNGFFTRAIITQACFIIGMALIELTDVSTHKFAKVLLLLGAFRMVWYDLLLLNPVFVTQSVGQTPVLNAASVHFGLIAFWAWLAKEEIELERFRPVLRLTSLAAFLIAILFTVRELWQGDLLNMPDVSNGENYSYSFALIGVSMLWIWRGMSKARNYSRIAGLALLTLATLKVFLIDAASLDGLLRVVSFLGLGAALIGIGWGYTRVMGKPIKV